MNVKHCTGIALTCLAASRLAATEFPDLKRLTPVAATEQIPVVDFFRPSIFQTPQLNYTGTHIGAIVSDDTDHTSLIAYDRVNQTIDGIGSRGDTDVTSFNWLNDKRLVYQVTFAKISGQTLYSGEAGNLSNSQPLFRNVGVSVFAVPPDDRSHPLANLFADGINTGHFDDAVTIDSAVMSDNSGVPVSDADANVKRILVRYPEMKTDHGFDLGFIADKEGKLAFGLTQQDGVLALNQLVGDSWVKCPEDLDQIDVVQAGDSPGEVTVLGPRDGTAPRPLEFMDARTGKAGDVLLQDKSYDFNGWLFRDPASHNIVGVVSNRAAPTVVWFTQAYRDLQKAVDGLFPGQVVRILGLDDSGKIVLISSGTDRQPVVYSWVDLEKHTSGLIKNSAPWIDPKRMRAMGVIKYKTAEGRQLDAYITLPAGATKANPPPCVVLLHPFIQGRSVWEFNAEVQFLASRGYAVLQPNYRGSAGYSWMFPEQDEWEFAKMSDDVTRATKTAIAMGLIDGKRVAIMGTSFGGYLAASGAAYEPGLYKCAISISSYYDWGRYMREGKIGQFSNSFYSRYLHKLGNPDKDTQKFDAIAPLRHADKVSSAMLITWGEYDDPELISESKDMASSVERNHVQVETMSFLNEAVGVNHLAHKLDLYSHLEAFLSKNL
jgi:dipeptidyl aminopeptidase/acylaminoacyl peptidase